MDTVTFIVYIETKINDDDKKAKDTNVCHINVMYLLKKLTRLD